MVNSQHNKGIRCTSLGARRHFCNFLLDRFGREFCGKPTGLPPCEYPHTQFQVHITLDMAHCRYIHHLEMVCTYNEIKQARLLLHLHMYTTLYVTTKIFFQVLQKQFFNTKMIMWCKCVYMHCITNVISVHESGIFLISAHLFNIHNPVSNAVKSLLSSNIIYQHYPLKEENGNKERERERERDEMR